MQHKQILPLYAVGVPDNIDYHIRSDSSQEFSTTCRWPACTDSIRSWTSDQGKVVTYFTSDQDTIWNHLQVTWLTQNNLCA